MKHYYVYILSCSDGTFYTGYTVNIRDRLDQHNGKGWRPGAKYTRSRRPVFLHYLEKHPTKSAAMKREYAIKQLTHKDKQALGKSLTKEDLLNAI